MTPRSHFVARRPLVSEESCTYLINSGQANQREALFWGVVSSKTYQCLTNEYCTTHVSFVQEYTLFGYLRHYWTDKRFAGKDQEPILLMGSTLENAWMPDTYISNSRESNLRLKDSEAQSSLLVSPDGLLFYSKGWVWETRHLLWCKALSRLMQAKVALPSDRHAEFERWFFTLPCSLSTDSICLKCLLHCRTFSLNIQYTCEGAYGLLTCVNEIKASLDGCLTVFLSG